MASTISGARKAQAKTFRTWWGVSPVSRASDLMSATRSLRRTGYDSVGESGHPSCLRHHDRNWRAMTTCLGAQSRPKEVSPLSVLAKRQIDRDSQRSLPVLFCEL